MRLRVRLRAQLLLLMAETGRAQAAALYDTGLSTREVAAVQGVEATTVRRWLREAEQTVRRSGPRGARRSTLPR